MTSQYGLYAYGLVGEIPEPLAIAGIDKKNSVYAVEGQGMRVMVSKIDIDTFQSQVKHVFSELTKSTGTAQSGTGALLQAHEDVVDTLMKSTTVVPFKFGTILKDEEAASKMLREDEEKFKQLLAKFTGRAEWGLKVYADTREFTQHIARTEPQFKDMEAQREKLSRGAAYLLGRKMEDELKNAVAARLASVSGTIFQDLAKDACEAKLNKTLPQKLTGRQKEMILNTVYLVERARVARFFRGGKRLREQYASMGLDLEVSGPWPPYSFTD